MMEIANQSFKFIERSLRAIIASMGLAIYVAASPASSYATLSQPRPSAQLNHRFASLVKQINSLSKSPAHDESKLKGILPSG